MDGDMMQQAARVTEFKEPEPANKSYSMSIKAEMPAAPSETVAGADIDMKEESAESLEAKCYCGKSRNLDLVELQCGLCLKFFHAQCISCHLGKCVPFMTNYHFFCKKCNPNGLESFNKKQASFSQMCHTAVANLMQKNPGVDMFSKDKDIIPFIDNYWESLTTMPRRIKLTWHNTIAKTMLKETDLFTCRGEEQIDPLFGLVNKDLTRIGPNYDGLKAALSQYRADLRPPGQDSTAKSTRGTKRKVPGESFVAQGTRQKRGEVASTKIAPSSFPTEHPFNKDGYRYILAEPDPHAPNRQAFDESLEWAGKPIPGYLYRMYLEAHVVLALHDRAPQLKISDNRLSVTGEKGYSMVRGTHGVNRGGWYFEVMIDDLPDDTATRIGWSQALGNLQAPCGYDKFSYSWRSCKGTRFHQSRGKPYSDSYQKGDVLGFYIYLPRPTDPKLLVPPVYKDKPLVKFKSHLYYEEKDNVSEAEKNLRVSEGSKVIFFKNGVNLGVAYTDLYEGIYFPAISLYKNAQVSANFGPNFKKLPKNVEDLNLQPMSSVVQEAAVDNALGDIIYHTENEGKFPEF